jgi:hypothetical protein
MIVSLIYTGMEQFDRLCGPVGPWKEFDRQRQRRNGVEALQIV